MKKENRIMRLTLKERLLKRLPKKYHVVVEDMISEVGLIDDCKYMLYFNEKYEHDVYGTSVPVKSITEAIMFIKEVDLYKKEGE